jgi:hypothetical protein
MKIQYKNLILLIVFFIFLFLLYYFLYVNNLKVKSENKELIISSISSCSVFNSLSIGGAIRGKELVKNCYRRLESGTGDYESVKMCVLRDIVLSGIDNAINENFNYTSSNEEYLNEENVYKRISSALNLAGIDESRVYEEIHRLKELSTKSLDLALDYCYIESSELDSEIKNDKHSNGKFDLIITKESDNEIHFKLVPVNEIECEYGDVSCIEITGIALLKDNIFIFNDDLYDCNFKLEKTSEAYIIKDLKGICGSGSGNRFQLSYINGIYQ